MQYKIKSVNPIGGYDKVYGQRYWGQVHDADMDVSFNMMNPVNFEEGETIEFTEKVIKETSEHSKNPGTEYIQLKKVHKVQPSLREKWDETSGQGEGTSSPTPSAKEPRGVPQTPKVAAVHSSHKSTAYLKDLSDYPVRLYTGNLNYAKDLGLNLISNDEDRRQYLEYIATVVDELLTWSDNIRSGEDIKKTAEGLFPGDSDV